MSTIPKCPAGYRFLAAFEIVCYEDLTLQHDGSLRKPFGFQWQISPADVGRYIRKDPSYRKGGRK